MQYTQLRADGFISPASLPSMPLSNAKRSDAVRQSILGLINNHGQDRCCSIVLTFRKPRSLGHIKSSIRSFAKYCKPHISSVVGVPGRSPDSSHVHLLGVCRDAADYSALPKIIRRARSKAGFAPTFNVEPIRQPEAFAYYLSGNLKKVLENRSSIRGRKGGPVAVFCGVPRSKRVKPTSFVRLCPKSKRFRNYMNELASMAGVEIDDIQALSSALGLSYRQIVAIVNRIHLFFPCSMKRVSKRALATAFPAIRRRYLEELNAEGGDWTDPREFKWHFEDEFLPQ